MDMIGHPPASRRSSSDARDSLRQHQLFSSAKRREDDGAPERQRRAFAERARCSGMRTGCTVRTAVVTRLKVDEPPTAVTLMVMLSSTTSDRAMTVGVSAGAALQ